MAPFVREGLERGEHAGIYIVDPATEADHVRHFQDTGFDNGARAVRGPGLDQAYLRGARFDPNALLGDLEELLRGTRQDYPRIRLVGHRAWVASEAPGVGDLIEYEARLNYLTLQYGDPVICFYEAAAVGGDIVGLTSCSPTRWRSSAVSSSRTPSSSRPMSSWRNSGSVARERRMLESFLLSAQAPDVSAPPEVVEPMALRRYTRDLAVLLALPAIWGGHDPPYIADGLLGVLSSLLRLDCVFVQLNDPTGGPAIAVWSPRGPRVPDEVTQAMAALPPRDRTSTTVSLRQPRGDETIRVTAMHPTVVGEDGIVLVGSQRSDFPTEIEHFLLRVAIGQAAVSIHSARLLAREQAARTAAERELRRRNDFLETLAHDLQPLLATTSEHAAEALTVAPESEPSPKLTIAPRSSDVPAAASVQIHHLAQEPDGAPKNGSGSESAAAAMVAPPGRLTRREAEVLGLLAQGLTNKEIAAVLWLSDRTVERHITGLYRKIGAPWRTEATAFALHHGLAPADAQTT